MLSVLSLPAFSFSAGAEEAPAAAEASTGEPDAGPEKENDGAEPEAAEARALPREPVSYTHLTLPTMVRV